MLIFREKEILSAAQCAFIENADFLSKQKWCKNRLCNGILFRQSSEFFEKIGLTQVELPSGELKRVHSALSRENLFDGFALLGTSLPKLTLSEKSAIGTMLSPAHCPLADAKTFKSLSLDFSERDFFFYAAQCKFLSERLNKTGIDTPFGVNWNISSVDVCVRHLFK